MRIIRVDELTEGMVIGRTIYGSNDEILLTRGTTLKSSLIEAIRHSKIDRVFIDDEFSNDIEPVEIINEEFRNNTVKKIKSFFTIPAEKMNDKVIEAFNKDVVVMIQDIIEQILRNREAVVNLVSLKCHNDYTFQHSVNVAVIAAVVGVELDYNRQQLADLAKGAMFHDIGKMLISQEILNKPGKLTADEYDIIKQHPMLGFNFAKTGLNLPASSLVCIMQHHERADGEGYPFGKTGEGIHRNAQIIAVADVFDAMTSDKVYHDAALPGEAIEYIMGNSDIHFSAEIVDIFLRKIAAYPVGSVVELSNGMKGVVCQNFEGYTLRPKVKIFTADPNQLYFNMTLPENASVTITKIVM